MQVRSVNGHRASVGCAGVIMSADVSLIEEVKVGDYLLIHAGFAISRWLPDEAAELLDLFGLNEESSG